ncbi:MAG: anhydro-N-acetylmuramic acid kinase [Bdellovibrionota bacterium]
MKPTIRILGLMSGTSCDGLDASCLVFSQQEWHVLWSHSIHYPKHLRQTVVKIQQPKYRIQLSELLELNRDLGLWYGSAINRMLSIKRPSPEVIANHGQTIAHFPDSGITMQIGSPAIISATTGLTVLSNFRDGDMSAGGQGAPLVPQFHKLIADKYLATSKYNGIAFHNIGGISNITYIGPDKNILAFDTGPGNIWIDAASYMASNGKKQMDADGKMSKLGHIDTNAVRKILTHKFFSKKIPKSTGRDDFPFELLISKTKERGHSLVATATAVTVQSIAVAYERYLFEKNLPVEIIVLCGGGSKNTTLVNWLQERIRGPKIVLARDIGLDEQFIESQAFAVLGFLSLIGHPLGGSWTGARTFGPPAYITPGKNWAEVVKKLKIFTDLSETYHEKIWYQ